MWTFIFLYTLALNICQATGKDHSTQMYYVKLTIEKSAVKNITQLLGPLLNNDTLTVNNLTKTTTCVSGPTVKECTCEPGFKWSNESCQSDKCSFAKTLDPMCISDTSVTITGSITLTDPFYHNCMADDSVVYENCNSKLLSKMKAVYSTLSGFDNFAVTKYRVGSIVAEFIMNIAGIVNPQHLITKTREMVQSLNASVVMETTGVVQLSIPHGPVHYDSKQQLTCSTKEDLEIEPKWHLRQSTGTYNITNGTGSTVISAPRWSVVNLRNISELWAGTYICTYKQDYGRSSIIHKASGVLDISLLPNIDITTVPAFPHCKTNSDFLALTAKCEIKRSTENYNVTWEKEDLASALRIKNESDSSTNTDIYMAETFVSCNSRKPALTCIFRNRLGQTKSAKITINSIKEGDHFCEADNGWETTKAGFTAVLRCEKATGKRQRKCKKGPTGGVWQEEESTCVNLEVNSVLESAITADIGLGSLDQNAANVFNRLQVVTNNTQSINTLGNMNASVYVFVSLGSKLQLVNNKSAVNDILQSSSNLLQKSLENSWSQKDEKDNMSLAERYLDSVEKLIEVTNSTDYTKTKNVMVAKCDETQQCTNNVFNVTVSLDTLESDSVKTTGFKNLVSYLPNKDSKYDPNSIVVSATTGKKQRNGITVKINFELLKPRRRNVKMVCVYWDKDKGNWSPEGCEWKGPGEEGHCVCRHLSSFAILMSRVPLDIPWISEITYVGLAISVLSLILCLVIELIVWTAVVKTNTLYLRHTAHVNISICLLVADICFLASSTPDKILEIWCKISVVLKHFCYLSMFFWMLCMSTMLLHQLIFPFHNVSKKNYLRSSLIVGYLCPFLIVAVTFITNGEFYFSTETCWLVYKGFMKGSIHTFVLPVGIIVFVNIFSMVVVIIKLLDHPKNIDTSTDKNKTAAKTVMRSVVLLTPIFGVTWIFGFAVMILDLTSGTVAYVVNYAFTLLNAFQGLFILLTTCLGDKLTRDALLNCRKKKPPASTTDSSSKLDSSWKK